MSSVDSTQDPQWIVQILFGRYRSWGAITVGHLIILSAVGVSLIYVYLILLKLRFDGYTRELQAIPRNYLPVRKKELGRTLYTTLINELVRVQTILEKKIEPEKNETRDIERKIISEGGRGEQRKENGELGSSSSSSSNGDGTVNVSGQLVGKENDEKRFDNPWAMASPIAQSQAQAQAQAVRPVFGDPGWGAEETKVQNVHFNTSIAKSYFVLEKTALARRPGLRHKDSRSIRDYVYLIKKTFPHLRNDLVDQYIRIYETAVFGDHKFNYEEYSQFMKIVYEMVAIINEKGWNEELEREKE